MIELKLNTEGLNRAAELVAGRAPNSVRSVILRAAAQGLNEALQDLVKEIREVTPIKTGRLRSSVRAFIGDTLAVSTDRDLPASQPLTSTRDGKINARIVALANYAGFVHEFFIPYPGAPLVNRAATHAARDPSTGGKFIEGKMIERSVFLVKSVAIAMRKSLETSGARATRQQATGATAPGLGEFNASLFGSPSSSRGI